MTPLLVLRPQPGARATVDLLHGAGWPAIAAPLFTARALDWLLPERMPQALLMTSANAARLGGPKLGILHALPVYAVGDATAAAARAAGFTCVIAGNGDAEAITARAVAEGVTTMLHLAGREHRAFACPIPIERRLVYAADAVEALPEAARNALPAAIALLHSPRAAATFGRLVDEAGLAREAIAIAAISPATAVAAGEGWRACGIADAPSDVALLAVITKLCDQGGDGRV